VKYATATQAPMGY